MKLRNKKTGEIDDVSIIHSNNKIKGVVEHEDGVQCLFAYTLEEFNEEWEDYEEPKEYWYIAELCGGLQRKQDTDNDEDRFNKQIGNYFETKEEAEKAVEKLKAWKLLRDECEIKFNGIIRDEKAMIKGVKLTYVRHQVTFDRMRECMAALHLLFGGEE